MKKQNLLLTFIIWFGLLAAAAYAQPRFLSTNLKGNPDTLTLFRNGSYNTLQIQATNSYADGNRAFSFLRGDDANSFTPVVQKDTAWQSVFPNKTLASYNQVIMPNFNVACAAKTMVAGYASKFPAVTAGSYYTVNVREQPATPAYGLPFAVLETAFKPTKIDTIKVKSKCIAANNPIKFTLYTVGTPNAAERFYFGYTTNLYGTVNIAEMTISGDSATYTIPANTLVPSDRIRYFAFSSTQSAATINSDNYDILSLQMFHNRLQSGNVLDTRGFTLNITGQIPGINITVRAPAFPLVGTVCGNVPVPRIILEATGASGVTTYAWEGANGNIAALARDTITAPTAASNGIYTVTASTSSTGCTASTTILVNLTFNPTLTVGTSGIPPSQCGAYGLGFATVTGGTSPYTYEWRTPTTNTNAESFIVGTNPNILGMQNQIYNVKATDAAGCTATNTIQVPPNLNLNIPKIAIDTLRHVYGCAPGKLCLKITGGQAGVGFPFFDWSHNINLHTACVGALTAGDYTVTVTDAAGCKAIETFTIEAKQPLALTMLQQVACAASGLDKGKAKVVVVGGRLPYTYKWAHNITSVKDTLINVRYGNCYTVTVTDSKKCTATASVCIDSVINITTTAVGAPTCFGGSNGKAYVSVIGAKPYFGFRYQWSTVTSDTARTLSSGIYTVTVTSVGAAGVNGNACTATATVAVANSANIFGITLQTTPTSLACSGDNNGKIRVINSVNDVPIKYVWAINTAANNQSFNGAAIDNVRGGMTYLVTVTGANGCVATNSAIITQPTVDVTPSVLAQSVRCKGENNGSINLVLAGAASTYTFRWIDGGVPQAPSGSETRTGLSPAQYGVIVTDNATGCVGFGGATITEPTSLLSASVVPASITNVVCFGGNDGKACVSAQGGVNKYNYRWNTSIPRITACVTDFEIGSYIVTVTDTVGCSRTASVTITGPNQPIDVSLSIINKVCGGIANGKILATATQGTTPYTYLWEDGQATNPAINLAAITHFVTITDSKGCTASAGITIPSVAVDLTVQDETILQGSNLFAPVSTTTLDPYTVLWSPAATVNPPSDLVPTLSPITTTTYTISISKDGCTLDKTLTITVTQKDGIFVPTAFAPGGNGPDENNYFKPIVTGGVQLTAFKVFNRWGQVVYDDANGIGWDGSFGGAAQPTGGYVYVLEYVNQSGKKDMLNGNMVLMR